MVEKASTSATPRTHTLTSFLARQIERLITTGQAAAGQRLNEVALAERFGVSRGPVREALRSLERSGLVSSIVNRGFFVREITLEEASRIYEGRAALFGMAGWLLAPKITDEQLEDLERMLEAMDGYAESGDLDAYYPLNLKFHAQIMTYCGNARLADMYFGLIKELHLYRRRSLVTRDSLAQSNKGHREVVDVLRKRDGNLAMQVMRDHVLSGRDRSLRAAREQRTEKAG